jgi:hypothetical protein
VNIAIVIVMLIEIEIGRLGIVEHLVRLGGIHRSPSYLQVILPISPSFANSRGTGLTDSTHYVHTSSRTEAGFELDWVVTLVWAPEH